MSCPPQQVRSLVVEISNSENFSNAATVVLPAGVVDIPVHGAAGDVKYVRSKWRRTSAVEGPPAIPAEESEWSNTQIVRFVKITDADVGNSPSPCTEDPPTPTIRTLYGWSEFLEASLLQGGTGKEGCRVWFAGYLGSFIGNFAGSMVVQNLSTDPTIKIESVDFIMGTNPPHCAGFTSFDGDPLAPGALAPPRQTDPYWTGVPTLDPDDPGSPKRGYDYEVAFLGAPIAKWVEQITIPVTEGSTQLVCPQDSELSETIPLAYHCMDAYFGARLTLVDFCLAERTVLPPVGVHYFPYPSIGVQIYARGQAVYINALGRTASYPFIQARGWPGTYGSFQGNASPFGRYVVRFSTGLVLSREGSGMSISSGAYGLEEIPTNTVTYELDDFFVFISESTFSDTLDTASGNWEDAVLLGEMPSGVYLAKIARDTNLMVSNLFGVPLEDEKTYYVRVGARRSLSFCPGDDKYLYSSTLSNIQTQVLNGTGSVSAPVAENAPIVGPSTGTPYTLVPGSGVGLDVDETERTITVSIDTSTLKESSGFLWVKSGDAVAGSDQVARFTADFDGTFKDWVIKALVAPTGQSVILDVNKNGTSIFANAGNRPTLTAGSTSATGVVFNVPNFVKGDVFTFDIDQAGSPVAGERVQLQLNFDSPLRVL